MAARALRYCQWRSAQFNVGSQSHSARCNLSGGGTSGATINGDVIANSGSKILPGSRQRQARLRSAINLTLNTGSTVKFKLSENPSFGNDQINVASGLNLNGTVNIVDRNRRAGSANRQHLHIV